MPKSKYFFLIFLFLMSCAVKKDKPTKILLSPLKINSQNKIFRQNPDKEIDILHTELNVSFDWENHLCHGKEKIIFKPYFYQLDSFYLDAKQFDILGVSLSEKAEKLPVKYTYDKERIVIKPVEKLKRDQTYILDIQYTANPDKATAEGSSAIRDAKGLYFINTKKTEPFKPTQLWTQGETEANSNWFATIDKPYEKMTFDINITVADSLTTLSNGLLVKSKSNNDNTRIDYWKVSKPMSAYLVMMAIGNFQKTSETWKDKEVSYFLEPAYHPYAKNIFKHTAEMIEFFSQKVGYEYPWEKYAQVVVRDFVSGAMENTSATLHGEFVQKNNRELIDNQNDGIIAHELFHHWFGDLVTCASWSHLTLNEGFATFGEQLWFGYKYGKEAELKHIYNSMNSYLRYSKRNDEAIVRFYYNDKEEMFNPITYQKGARVLNLLRHTIGDVAFFEAIKNYLHNYEFKTAQLENFRHEMEKTSGKDLKYFFNQWFLRGGHPIIEVTKNSNDGKNFLIINQTQKDSLFSFPFEYRIGKEIKNIICHKKKTEIKLEANQDSKFIHLDPNGIFIGEIDDKIISDSNLVSFYQNAETFIEKMRILSIVKGKKSKSIQEDKLLLLGINDKNPEVSTFCMKAIDWETESNLDKAKEDLKQIATLSSNSEQKSQAIYVLSGMNDKLLYKSFENWSGDSSYKVAAAALYALEKIKSKEAFQIAKALEQNADGQLFNQIAKVYAKHADSSSNFFSKNLLKRFGGDRNQLISSFGLWAERFGEKEQTIFWNLVGDRAQHDEKSFIRFSAMNAMHKLNKNSEFISNEQKMQLQEIMINEPDERIKRQLQINKMIAVKEIEK